MRFHRVFVTALRAILRNPMRATLTTLGIVIGVAAVIAMMEIGKGASSTIQKSIAAMGANSVMVMPGTAASQGISFGEGTVITLAPQDCDAIMRECPAVQTAAPIVRARLQVVYGNRNWVPSQIAGTTAAYLDVRDWTQMAEGVMFSERDVLNGNKVCVLGQTIVRELFQGESPVGKEMRVQNVTFKVVGVLSSKGANMMGSDQDDVLLAPWTTLKYRVVGSTMSAVNQSSSSAGSSGTSSAVNTLNGIYPSSQTSLYPVPSSTQQADTPLAR